MLTALHQVNTVTTGLTNSSKLSESIVGGPAEKQGIAENPFSGLFRDAVGKVNQLEDTAREAVDGFMTGKGVDIHQVMIASEKASMAFELALALRNKAVQSYQSIMSMQF